MTVLDVGSIAGRVTLDDVTFQRTYVKVVGQMRTLGVEGTKSAEGVATLDDAFAGLGKTTTTASEGVAKTTRAVTASTTAEERAARAAQQHAAALGRVDAVMQSVTGESARVQESTLRQAAAQQRLAAASADAGSAEQLQARETARLASAQASAMTATRGLAAAQAEGAVTAAGLGTKFGGLLHTVRDFGLVFGAIEIAKKTAEFVGAGKDLTTALNSVQAAAQATDAQMAPVRQQVIGLGKDMTLPAATAVDAAEAIDDLVRSGMTLPRALAAARSALLLASAANTDTAFSARVLGDALDEFQLPASQAAKVASMLGAAATGTAGGLETVFDALRYSGSRARAAKIPMDDLLASIVDLSKAGLQGTTIGTGLAMSLVRLTAHTPAVTSALKDMGIQAWDAQGRFKGMSYLVDSVFQAQKRFGNDSHRFLSDVSAVFGARAGNAIAAFAGKGIDGLDRAKKRIDEFDLQHAANTMNRGFSAAMRAVRKEAVAAGIDLYQGLEPRVVSVAHWFGEELPKAGHAAAAVFGGPLHVAFAALAATVELAGAVLKPVIDLLDSPVGSAVATGVLAMWAAWKGYTIAVAAGRAIADATGAMAARANSAMISMQNYGSGVQGVFAGQSSSAALAAAQTQESLAQIEAAALEEAAGVDRAAAVQAEAYATLVAASDDATAAMISNSQNAALAAQEQAAASAEAAAAAATAAEAAAADVDAAGEAAAVGWAGILGPVGLVAVGVTAAASAFGLFGTSAEAQVKPTDDFTNAILRDNGALGENTRALLVHKLESEGAYDAALKLGVSQRTLTDAFLGSKTAMGQLHAAMVPVQALLDAPGSGYGSGTRSKQTRDQIDAYNKLAKSIPEVSKTLQVNKQAAENEAKATGTSTAAANTNTAARRTNATATKTNADAVKKLVAAEMTLISVSLSQAQSQDQFLESVRATTAQLKGNNGTLSKNTANGLANRDALLASVQAALSLKDAQDKAGGSVRAHTRNLADNIASLKAAAIAAGADKGQVDQLLQSLHATPREIRSTITVDDAEARAKAKALLDWLRSQVVTVHVTTDASLGGSVLRTGTTGTGIARADGGPIVGPGGPRADVIPIMASNDEHMVSAAEVKGLGGHAAVAAIRAAGRAGRRVMGFADGGGITTGTVGGKKTWNFGGQQYASQRAAENAQARAGTKEQKLKVEISSKDIPGLMSALTKTTAQLITAEHTLTQAAREAGLTHKALARVADAETRLNGLSRTRNRIAGQLGAPSRNPQTAWQQLEAARASYQGERSSVASTITGGFDLATAGRSSGTGVTLASIEGDAAQQRHNADLFNHQLRVLSAHGLGKAELQQLAEKGFAGAESSTLALLGASRGQLRQLNGNVAGLGAAAGQTGTFTADLLYGPGVKQAQQRVNDLRAQERRVDARMEKIGRNIAETIRRGLGMEHGGGHHHTHVKVVLGTREITDIVRTEVTHETRKVARNVHLQGGRG